MHSSRSRVREGRLELVGASQGRGPGLRRLLRTRPTRWKTPSRRSGPIRVGSCTWCSAAAATATSGKRPIMGAIATRLADRVYVTDDNPRTEDPASIRAAIMAAAPGAIEIGNRGEAIRAAVDALDRGRRADGGGQGP